MKSLMHSEMLIGSLKEMNLELNLRMSTHRTAPCHSIQVLELLTGPTAALCCTVSSANAAVGTSNGSGNSSGTGGCGSSKHPLSKHLADVFEGLCNDCFFFVSSAFLSTMKM